MSLPQSILDDLNSFASGRRDWSHWPNWFAMYARSLARELSPSHMKWLKVHPREEIALILGEMGIAIDSSIPPENRPELLHDPIEDDLELLVAFNAASVAAKRKMTQWMVNRERYFTETGNCHLFWRWQKEFLREQYGIDWKTPAEMNPDVRFD